MSQFGSKGKRGYREFVGEGIKQGISTPWDEVRGQAVMGSEEFIEEVMNRQGRERGKKTEVARRKELVGIKPEAIMAAVGKYYGIKPQEMKGRGWRYTEPRHVASYLMRRYGLMGLREIGEWVGLHFSAVGNAVQRVADNPTRTMAQSLRELERKFKNQES
jgi:chromosomal replication initiation ATPase DnaA